MWTRPWTSRRRSYYLFDKVWQRCSSDNGMGNFFQNVRCTFRFFSVYQSILLHAFFLNFSLPSPSSWLFQLPSSVTTQNNSWYAMISLKSWRFDGKLKGRRKRRPRLLASREARIWKQLNLLPWMLAITLTKLTTVHLPSRILFVSLYWALRLGSPLFLDICSHYNGKLLYRKRGCNLCRVYYEQIDQFRIALSLCFKARLSCSPTTFSIQISASYFSKNPDCHKISFLNDGASNLAILIFSTCFFHF